jgi:cobalt/nickel transport protein
MLAVRAIGVLAALAIGTTPVVAHYNMLLLSSPSVKKGEEVTLLYQWGHPFEHQLFDAPMPQSLVVIAPDGKKTELTKMMAKIGVQSSDEKRIGFRARFTPEQRGDHIFVLRTPPIWMEEEHEFYEDTVKVVLHVQAQKGWDQPTSPPFEFVPLTRPYGLLPGSAFQAQGLYEANPLSGVLVEVERYNETPPKELPADEFITHTVKTDPNGVVTCTLPEAGWWCLTAQQRTKITKDRDGKKYPVRRRTTFWLFVDEKVKPARNGE